MKRRPKSIADFFKKRRVDEDETTSVNTSPASEPFAGTVSDRNLGNQTIDLNAVSDNSSSSVLSTVTNPDLGNQTIDLNAVSDNSSSSVLSTVINPDLGTKTSNLSEPIYLSTGPLEEPVQPEIDFPLTNGRRFSARYYGIHQWIEYSESEDAVYCFACRHFAPKSSMRAGEKLGNRAFIEKGFKKWKDATALFKQHEMSERHMAAMSAWANRKNRSSSKMSVASILSTERSVEIEENRNHVKMLLKVVSFLGRQGLAFRGKDESDDSFNKGNFLEMLETLSDDNPNLKEKMSRRYGHYTSPEYQNDLIHVFASRIAQNIVGKVQEAGFFSLMADETKDISKEEQLAVLVRYVDKKDLKIKERAIGLHHLKDCGAESIANEMLSLLSKKGLEIKKCLGQCYDGAKVMSGVMKGVQARIKELAPHALYFHCHAHRLNLVLVHSLGFVEEVKDFFSTLQTIYCFISNSSPRHEMFLEAQKKLHQPVLRLERLVPTRWFYWFEAVRKVLKTLKAILCVLAEVRQDRAESIGIRSQIEQPCFLFLLCAMELVLGITYSLSQQLQSETLDLIAAESLIESTKQELIRVRSEVTYEKLLKQAKLLAEENNIQWNINKRKKSIPPRLSESVIFSTMGKHEPNAKSTYFQILDTILEEFERRFSDNQDLMKSSKAFRIEDDSFLQVEVLEPIINKYKDFLDIDQLEKQLPLARTSLKQICVSSDPLNYLQELNKLPIAYSEVISLIKIFLTLPITTAGNERFFSVLKRVKNYLRSTTSNDRLASLMLLAVEREEVKTISLDQLVDDFAKMKPRRYPLLH